MGVIIIGENEFNEIYGFNVEDLGFCTGCNWCNWCNWCNEFNGGNWNCDLSFGINGTLI